MLRNLTNIPPHALPSSISNTNKRNKCHQCKNAFPSTTNAATTRNIHKYIKKWICAECTGKDKSDKEEMRAAKLWTECRCTYPTCPENENDKTWTGHNAYRNWSNHYSKHHPTKEYLQITNKQFCAEPNCTNIIPSNESHPHCMNHRYEPPSMPAAAAAQIPLVQDRISPPRNDATNIADKEDITIDGDGLAYDINRIINYHDIDEKWRSE